MDLLVCNNVLQPKRSYPRSFPVTHVLRTPPADYPPNLLLLTLYFSHTETINNHLHIGDNRQPHVGFSDNHKRCSPVNRHVF